MGLRLQDPIPEWITHVALVHGGHVKTGERVPMLETLLSHAHEAAPSTGAAHSRGSRQEAAILVDMQNVNVRYHERHVRRFSSRLSGLAYICLGLEGYQLDYPCRGSLALARRERYINCSS